MIMNSKNARSTWLHLYASLLHFSCVLKKSYIVITQQHAIPGVFVTIESGVSGVGMGNVRGITTQTGHYNPESEIGKSRRVYFSCFHLCRLRSTVVKTR